MISLFLAAAGTGFHFYWLDWLLGLIDYACYILALAIFVYTLLPWFGIGYSSRPMALLSDLISPILSPLRRRMPTLGRLDLSPLAAILMLYLVPTIIRWLVLLIVR